MAKPIKAQIAPVNLGCIQIEGLLGEDGGFYVAVPQISERFQFLNKNASRDIKALLGIESQFAKIKTPLNPKAVNALPIATVEDLVLILARKGNIEAQRCLGWESAKPLSIRKKLMSLYVFMTEDHMYVKIGISRDPEKRLNAVQTGCPTKISVIFTKPLRNAVKIERLLHQKLADFNTNGEWFDSSVFAMINWSAL